MIKTLKTHKSHRHCVYQLTYHLVLVTKYRHKCFTKDILERLEEICRDQFAKWEIELIEFDGEADHVHLLLDMHPNIMPSRFFVTDNLCREMIWTMVANIL